MPSLYKYTDIPEPFDRRPPHGGVNWIEIPSNNPDKAREFYQSIFPSWKFENPSKCPPQFIQLFKVEEPSYMEGAILKTNKQSVSTTNAFNADAIGCVPSFFADSIDEIHDKILSLGGKLCCPKTDGRGDGWYAKYFDLDGNVFQIWEVRVKE
nr:glyoxalase bleomycin resistance protein dioxygenase [Colletotrichum truncatum]KAF6790181.1 glyoxalase bleomycin resistance protein dioxygenase [Colletotrichum truncatum]